MPIFGRYSAIIFSNSSTLSTASAPLSEIRTPITPLAILR